MKAMIKASIVLVFFIMLVSCATAPRAIPDRLGVVPRYHIDI
jgi:hypothetical protein